MKINFKIVLLTTIIIIMINIKTNAQSSGDSVPELGQFPSWIKMIDDPQANYYDAIKAFDAYFKDHLKPMDEEDMKAEAKEKDNDNESGKADKEYVRSLTPEELNKYLVLKYQVKRFEHWIREVKPFVQEDGHILTDEERAAIWQKQQEEIKRQQK